MKKLLLFLVLTLCAQLSSAQVTKSDATAATLDNSIATRNFSFTSGEFGGCASLTEVEVALTLTVTDNSGCNPGAFGVHSDIAVSLESPSGTVVHLVQDFSGILIGSPPIEITYQDSGFPNIVNQTAVYDDDATLLADDQTDFGAGTWKPHNPLSAFDGEDPAGTWILRVADGRSQGFPDFTCYLGASVTVTCGAACTDPTVPTLTSTPSTVCTGGTASLNISGTLNDATAWQVYTGSCGGTNIGSTTTGTFAIPGTITAPTTYFVRGEGGCVTPGTCGSITITPQALDDPSFSYSAASYCVNDADPTPTVTGLPGGTFSATPGGLNLNTSTGAIDVSLSTPGTYTVTYTTSGACPNSSNVSVTINGLDDPSFSYSAAAYCVNDADPTPTVTGLPGGSFSATPGGLNLNTSTGAIDVSLSTPGSYTVTYTTAGACPSSSNVSVTINGLDDPSFSYSAASYCVNDADPTPTVTGLPGGTFSSTAGLSLNTSTGQIDVSASTPNTYTVTYTTGGTCPSSSNVSVTINGLDDPSFSYSAGTYCQTDADPTPTITGLPGGTFSSTAGLSINTGTGQIDVSASTPNTYTVTYTTTGACPNASNVSVTIQAPSAATFTALADICVDAGVQTGLGGGSPTGGVYSGPGVTDDGNGMTYSFDPAAAGVGTHTITYTPSGGCSSAANDNVEVFALPSVTFTALADICVDAGVQTGLGGGSPTGGVYSGPGVTDDGNGMTYSFDPAAAGVGTHTITYTFTNGNGCTASANDQVEVFALPSVTFTALSDLCLDAGVQAGLSGGSPTGGVYSGPGVTDDGNGTTYTFDPAAAGVGVHTITYTFTNGNGCTASDNDQVEVFASPTVTFTGPGTFCSSDGVQTGLSGGTPTGGVYSGTGVTDDGNGMTYSFDPAAAGVGTHTISYTFTNGNGCTAVATDNVTVSSAGTVTAVCQDVTIYLDNNGMASIVPADIDGGSSVGCGTLNLAADITTFDCSNTVTPVSVTLTVTDGLGGSATCTANVTVLDTISPVANCQDLTVYLDATGNATITAADVTNQGSLYFTGFNNDIYQASKDGSGTPTILYGTGTSNDLLVGIDYIPETDELMWANGLAAEITTAPADGSGPITILPNSQGTGANAVHSQDVDFANNRYFFSGNANGVYEASLDGTGTATLINGTVTGLNTVEYDASNARIFTNDVQNSEIYSMNDNGTGLTTLFTAADGVAGPRDIVYDPSQDMIYWTNRDANNIMMGNADGTGTPVVVYSGLNGLYELELDPGTGTLFWVESQGGTDDIMSAPKDGTGTPAVVHSGNFGNLRGLTLENAGNTDNCSTPTASIDISTFDCTNAGSVVTVTMTVTDDSGNSTTCSSQVTVIDSIAPTIACPADIVQDQDAGVCSADITVPNITTADNCSGETLSWTISGATTVTGTGQLGTQTFTVGVSTVDVTATDASGNTASCSFFVTVNDTVAPVQPVLADSVADCSVTLTAPTTTDNCAGTITGTTTDPTTVTSQGTTVVTWTFDDGLGNITTATQNVIITDAVPPTASNIDTAFAECIGDVAIDVTLVDDEADNCTAAPVVAYVGDVASNGTGCNDTVTRTYSVTDDAGNSINVQQIIILNDVTAPTASNPITLNVVCLADVPSQASSTSWVTDEADNCGAPTVTWLSDVPSNGTGCSDTITRTFEVADACGNSIQVQQLIIVNDDDNPVADVATLADITGTCDVTPTAPTATDNCAGTINGVPDVTFPINTVGTTLVTWTYTDNCGNAITQTQNVTVTGVDVNTTMASDGITMIASNNNAGVTYQWIDCETNQPVSGATNVNFTPTYGSDFAVIVTENGCVDTSACVNSTVGLDQLSLEQFIMYPNPTETGSFTIQLEDDLKRVSVLDMTGRIVEVDVNLTEKSVNVSELVNGAYIVRVVTEKEQELIGTIRVQ
ncbi:MAG: T9SS type A sorting domain-containing protein [Fluviicola sp.]